MEDNDFNGSSKQTESNENTEEIKEIDFENINLDETPSKEGNSGEEISENEEGNEETEQDFSEFDNFVPSSRFNSKATITPFLEQSIEPVENLERDLQGNSGARFAQTGNQPEIQNAPQYSSSSGDYTDKNYYEKPTDNTYPQMIKQGPSRLSSPINPNEAIGWRNQENSNQEDSGYPREQNYRFASDTSETRKRRDVL